MEDKFSPNEEQQGEDKLRQRLKFKSMPTQTDPSALWERIRANMQEEAPVRSIRSGRPNRIYWMAAAAAAAIALVLTFVFLWPTGMEQYQTPMAETLELDLPDRSTVVVNAGSELRYAADRWAEERKVRLRGEAFFQVEKGARFVVVTELGEVEVLGTAFNVFSRTNTFSVSCQEGSVAVRSTTGKETVLEAGDAATLLNGEWQTSQRAPEAIATWRSGLYTYDSQPIGTVLEEVERQYDVSISYPEAIGSEMITMRFEKSQPLQEALEPILFSFRLSFKRSGQKIVLERNE